MVGLMRASAEDLERSQHGFESSSITMRWQRGEVDDIALETIRNKRNDAGDGVNGELGVSNSGVAGEMTLMRARLGSSGSIGAGDLRGVDGNASDRVFANESKADVATVAAMVWLTEECV
jgi:hypothetical protein